LLSPESLSTLLYAIVTRYPDRAKNLIYTTDELDDDERARLRMVVEDDAAPPVEQARRLGDALREHGPHRELANECYRLAFYLSDESVDLVANPLFAYFVGHRSGRLLDKWVHYFPIYDRHLSPYRGQAVKLLEIGVFRGGSLDMWERYLGASSTLIGIDIDEEAARLADPRCTILIGDQADRDFLGSVIGQHGPFDIIIDDGGHTMEQQIASIETLFPSLNEGGVYLVEDCHTSYWKEYGGGRGHEGTFIEWVKDRIDDLHGYHLAEPIEPVWTEHVDAIHCYDSVIVVDKKRRFAPFCEQVGTSDFLFKQRPTSELVDEMLATRDAAIIQREEAMAQMRRSESARQRAESERQRAESELTVIRNDVDEARDQVKAMRHTFSWRVTTPLRMVRRRLGNRK
jgi:Methyltransferase domain